MFETGLWVKSNRNNPTDLYGNKCVMVTHTKVRGKENSQRSIFM